MFTVSSLLWRLVIGGAVLAVGAYYKIDIETAEQVAIATLNADGRRNRRHVVGFLTAA